MLPAPHASGRAAVGCCPKTWASSTRRLVRRSSPRSASANASTAQLASVMTALMPDSSTRRLLLERFRREHVSEYAKRL